MGWKGQFDRLTKVAATCYYHFQKEGCTMSDQFNSNEILLKILETVQETQTQVISLQTQVNSMQTQMNSMQTQINNVETLAIENAKEIAGLKDRVSNVETLAVENAKEMASLKDRINDVEVVVLEVNDKVIAVDAKVDALANKADAINSKVDAVDAKIDSLKEVVCDQERDTNRLELKVARLKTDHYKLADKVESHIASTTRS